jgi:hypothetical protein
VYAAQKPDLEDARLGTFKHGIKPNGQTLSSLIDSRMRLKKAIQFGSVNQKTPPHRGYFRSPFIIMDHMNVSVFVAGKIILLYMKLSIIFYTTLPPVPFWFAQK